MIRRNTRCKGTFTFMHRPSSPRPSRPLVAALVALSIAATSSDHAGATSTSPVDDPAPSSATDAFPVTVEHQFGTTTIETEPTRVVTIGWNDQDTVLALGVVPLAYRDWFEEYPTFPWVVERLDGVTMEPLVGEVNLELISSLDPDLIIDVYDTVDAATYERYSEIAPTVVQTSDYPDEATPWQEQTRLIGRALGRSTLAAALVEDVESAFEAAAAANPSFEAQVLVANFYPDLGTGEQWLLPHGDPRRQLFDRLGFAAQDAEGATSAERIDLLDRDVLVVNGVSRQPWMSAMPTAATLNAILDDRAVFIDGDSPVSGALAYGSVLSLPYALERLLPALEAAADGDPDTAVNDV